MARFISMETFIYILSLQPRQQKTQQAFSCDAPWDYKQKITYTKEFLLSCSIADQIKPVRKDLQKKKMFSLAALEPWKVIKIYFYYL